MRIQGRRAQPVASLGEVGLQPAATDPACSPGACWVWIRPLGTSCAPSARIIGQFVIKFVHRDEPVSGWSNRCVSGFDGRTHTSDGYIQKLLCPLYTKQKLSFERS